MGNNNNNDDNNQNNENSNNENNNDNNDINNNNNNNNYDNNNNNNNNNNINTNEINNNSNNNGGPGSQKFLAEGKMCPPAGKLTNVNVDDGVEGCFHACTDTMTCTHFTWWPEQNRCRLFSACSKVGARTSEK